MLKIFSKAFASVMFFALILFFVPNVLHADSGSIEFGIMTSPQMQPITVSTVAVHFGMQNVKSTNPISKVTATLEGVTHEMTLNDYSGGRYSLGYGTDFDFSSLINGKKEILVIATDVNGYSASHTYSITLDDPQHNISPKAYLTRVNNEDIGSNQSFDLNYKIDNVIQSVFAQDIPIIYDSTAIEFISAESYNNDLKILATEITQDKLRIVISSVGQKMDTTKNLIKLHFKSKSFDKTRLNYVLVQTVSISNDKGNEYSVGGSPLSIVVGIPNKKILNEMIVTAQSVHDSAIEGSGIGNYPVGSKAKFKAAIEKSKIVSENEDVGQEQVNTAKTELENVIKTFQNSAIASPSTPTNPTTPTNPPVTFPKPVITGDLNNDSVISVGDIGVMSSQYGKATIDFDWVEYFDLNHNGKVDIEDLILLAAIILTVAL